MKMFLLFAMMTLTSVSFVRALRVEIKRKNNCWLWEDCTRCCSRRDLLYGEPAADKDGVAICVCLNTPSEKAMEHTRGNLKTATDWFGKWLDANSSI